MVNDYHMPDGRFASKRSKPVMTLEHLARTIAKARHGTDAMWANYMDAAKAAAEWSAQLAQTFAVEGADLIKARTAKAIAEGFRDLG